MSTLMPLFEASLRGALLIGVLALLRAPLRRLIGSPWLCALWLVVLVRLLLPGSIQSSWSVFNWWPERKAVQLNPTPLEARVTVFPASGFAATTGAASNEVKGVAIESVNHVDWLAFVWAVGAAFVAASLGWRFVKAGRIARSTRPATDCKLLEAFDSIPRDLRGNVSLREAQDLEVPALVGLWRPQIWMPASWLETMTAEELRHVLLHELGHARRGDLWVQWLFALAQCVHWFNPAVWLAARLAHADRELACDAWVIRRAEMTDPEPYGATLVKAAQLLRSRWHLPPVAITMAMSKGSLFSRVRSIGQFQPIAGWRAVLGSIGVGLLLGSLATDRLHAQSGGLAPAVDPAAAPAPAEGSSAPPAPTGAGVFGEIGAGYGIAQAPVPIEPMALNPYGAGMAGMPAPAPYQVEVQARFIEMKMPEAGWKALGLNDVSAEGVFQMNSVLDPNGLHALLAQINAAGVTTGVDLLSAPRVTTKSGQRAVIEIIREFRYPSQFQPDQKQPDGLLPIQFETRNIGITLEAEPTVAPDGSSVDLGLVPQIVELMGFVRVRDGQPIPLALDPTKKGLDQILNASLPKDAVVQPIFSTRKISTSVRLRSGDTIVLGGLKHAAESQAAEESRVLFVLITARVIPSATTMPAAGPALPGGVPAPGIYGEVSRGAGTPAYPVAPAPVAPPGGGFGVPVPGGAAIYGAPAPPPPAQPAVPPSFPGAAPGGAGTGVTPGMRPPQPVPIPSGIPGAGRTVAPGGPPSLQFTPGQPGASPRPPAGMPAPGAPLVPGSAPAPLPPASPGR
jgi:beta-lactamase regulating signal transducer with metallopeptidase domain